MLEINPKSVYTTGDNVFDENFISTSQNNSFEC